MASIQVLELRPVEDQVEDLSYDVAGNIAGGGVIEDVGLLIQQLLLFSEKVLDACASGAISQETCDDFL